MKKISFLFLLGFTVMFSMSSCFVNSKSMKEPQNYIQFEKGDFEYSEQVSGEATEDKVFMVDWSRLFLKTYGETQAGAAITIPIIGGVLGNKVNGYAIYNMLKDNPGYDIVLYPQFETETQNFFLFKHTKVKVTARLGKLKK